MKTNIFILALLICSVTLSAQFNFSISSGTSLSGAKFGYNTGIVNPYLSINYLSAAMNYDESESSTMNGIPIGNWSDKVELSGSVFIPTVGVKIFAPMVNKLKPYLNSSISFPIIGASYEDDGDNDEEFDEYVSNGSSLGLEMGIGVEYFVDDNFSIGGEFGWQRFSVSSEAKFSDTFLDGLGNVYVNSTDKEISMNLSPTYSRFSLNFYF